MVDDYIKFKMQEHDEIGIIDGEFAIAVPFKDQKKTDTVLVMLKNLHELIIPAKLVKPK